MKMFEQTYFYAESKLDDAVKRYNLSSTKAAYLKYIDADLDFQNRYVDWCAAHISEIMDADSRTSDVKEQIRPILHQFRSTGRNIDDFKSYALLKAFVEGLKSSRREAIYSGKNTEDAEIIKSTPEYRLVWLKTFEGATTLYRGNTAWCIAKNEDDWDREFGMRLLGDYENSGTLFIAIEVLNADIAGKTGKYICLQLISMVAGGGTIWSVDNKEEELGGLDMPGGRSKVGHEGMFAKYGQKVFDENSDLISKYF